MWSVFLKCKNSNTIDIDLWRGDTTAKVKTMQPARRARVAFGLPCLPCKLVAPAEFFLAMSSALDVFLCSMRRLGMLKGGLACMLSVLNWWRSGRCRSGLGSDRLSSLSLLRWFLSTPSNQRDVKKKRKNGWIQFPPTGKNWFWLEEQKFILLPFLETPTCDTKSAARQGKNYQEKWPLLDFN